MPLYDVKCDNKDCKEYEKIKEILIFSQRIPYCDDCLSQMTKITGYMTHFRLKGSWPGADYKKERNKDA